MFHGLTCFAPEEFFVLCVGATRGHNFKIVQQHCRLDCNKYYFTNRIIPVWNSLPSEIVHSRNVTIFREKAFGYYNNLVRFLLFDEFVW